MRRRQGTNRVVAARVRSLDFLALFWDEALQIVERTGERWLAAELNRHKGQLLLRQRHSEAAEELYRKALSIAEEQEAKLAEAPRAAMGQAGPVLSLRLGQQSSREQTRL
jgi:predicted negative regulator of RcsB-dependent stress response